MNKQQQKGVWPQGDTLIFSSYAGSGPASPPVHPPPPKKKNIRDFKHPQKRFEILATPKQSHILYIDFKKTLKSIDMSPKYSPILWWPQNIST